MCKQGQQWSPEQLQLLKDHYPDKKTTEVATLIGKTAHGVYAKAVAIGVRKSSTFKASPESGRWFSHPIGSERINSKGYLLRKVSNSQILKEAWRYVHVLVWEQYYGVVPQGYVVAFKNGDKRNIDIGNLELITRKDCLLRVTIHRYPNEVMQLIRLQKKLKRAINKGAENA